MKSKRNRWSDREIAAYHDALSEEEIIQEIESADWKPVDFVVERSKSQPVSISLPPEVMTTVKKIARRQGVDYHLLLQQWVQERAEKEHSTPARSRL
jgi:predicted DNA binding CopG/RHH family protein